MPLLRTEMIQKHIIFYIVKPKEITILIQGISRIFLDQMPTYLVFKKVHSMLAYKFSTVYHLMWQSSRMTIQNLNQPEENSYIHTALHL